MRPPVGRRPFRLTVEQLEDRNCPSTPVIDGFMAASIYHTTVTVMGHVSDANPATCWISISGVMRGSTMANAQGAFSYTGQADSLGTVRAAAVNDQGLVSNLASAQVASSPPTITNFTAIHQYGTIWTFAGQVTDPSGAGQLTVTLGGLPSLNNVTATVQDNGWFSVTVQLANGENGTATAQTTDWWGLQSNVAMMGVG
jgi:hypothetical protein